MILPSAPTTIDRDVYARGGLAILRGESLYHVSVNGLPFADPSFAAALCQAGP